MTTFKYEQQLSIQVNAIKGQHTVVEALMTVATDPEFKAEDVGTYLLHLEEQLKQRVSKASMKVIKSETKTVLEYAIGARKGQEDWTREQCQEQLAALASEAGSISQLAKAARADIREQNEPSEAEEKAIDVTGTIDNMLKKLIDKGCDKADIKKALQAAIKAL